LLKKSSIVAKLGGQNSPPTIHQIYSKICKDATIFISFTKGKFDVVAL